MYRGHGSAHDRGSADAYYGRPFNPHYFEGGSYTSKLVTDLTPEQVAEYREGYEGETDRKLWD